MKELEPIYKQIADIEKNNKSKFEDSTFVSNYNLSLNSVTEFIHSIGIFIATRYKPVAKINDKGIIFFIWSNNQGRAYIEFKAIGISKYKAVISTHIDTIEWNDTKLSIKEINFIKTSLELFINE